MVLHILHRATKRMRSPLLLGVSIFVFLMSVATPVVSAATLDQQIRQLKQNNSQTAQKKQQLGAEAATLSGTIAGLQAEIADLESQITKNRDKVTALTQDIAKAEAELAHQRELLAMSVRTMYIEQSMSTFEMLASSKSLSHFMDQEQYRIALQDKIDKAAKNIEKIMAQLESEKASVSKIVTDQQAMQDTLNARRAENARLLSLNQEQQQAFQNQLNANNTRITQLQLQQAALNNKGFIGRTRNIKTTAGGSYPWANAPFPNTLSDPWGMYKRQCVSYAAWKVASTGRHMPYWAGRGNANLWDDNARSAGIPVDGHPRPGDVAISNAGTYGHAMYIESVNGDGTINVSQYNASWDGTYSEGRRRTDGLVFIHF